METVQESQGLEPTARDRQGAETAWCVWIIQHSAKCIGWFWARVALLYVNLLLPTRCSCSPTLTTDLAQKSGTEPERPEVCPGHRRAGRTATRTVRQVVSYVRLMSEVPCREVW